MAEGTTRARVQESEIHWATHADIRDAIVREAVRAGLPNVVTITPPPAESGRCCHCGAEIDPTQNVRAMAVAGANWARHPETGKLLRMRVVHCDACLDSEACSLQEQDPAFCHEIAEGA